MQTTYLAKRALKAAPGAFDPTEAPHSRLVPQKRSWVPLEREAARRSFGGWSVQSA